MNVVIDTSILVAALRNRNGASNALLVDVLEGKLRWLCSVPLFYEYEAVLSRPTLLMDLGRSLAEMNGFLMDLAAIGVPVDLHFLWRPQLRDPDDELLVETAANGQADFLVTHNLKDFAPVVGRFGFEIVAPGELLRRRRS